MTSAPNPVKAKDAKAIGEEPVPWECYVPGAILLVPMLIAFALKFFSSDDGMIDWAVSRQGIFAKEFDTLQLHMFAHGSILHIWMNGASLFFVGAIVVQMLGSGPRAWLKFFLLFELCGLGGAITFLLTHQWNDTPMLGASAAIYGLIGFQVRFPKNGSEFIPLLSSEMLSTFIAIVKDHFWLFLVFVLPAFLSGRSGGLAWEAHLGGFVIGLIMAPRIAKLHK